MHIGTTQSLLNEWTRERIEWAECDNDGSPPASHHSALALYFTSIPVVVKILLPVSAVWLLTKLRLGVKSEPASLDLSRG